MNPQHNPYNPNCPLNISGWAASIPPYCNCSGAGQTNPPTPPTPNYCPHCGHKLT